MEAARSMRSSSNSWWHTSATHFQSMRWFRWASLGWWNIENMAKGTTDSRHWLSTLTNLTHKGTSASKSRLNSSLKISTNFSLKNQLQNLDQYSAPISSPNQLQNLDQSSVSKSWPKVSFKILINTQPQYLHPTSASKSRPNYHQHVPQHQHLQH